MPFGPKTGEQPVVVREMCVDCVIISPSLVSNHLTALASAKLFSFLSVCYATTLERV